MKFEKEMDQFFNRNCYFEPAREKVRALPAYRRASENNDAVEAQEIATRFLEGTGRLEAKPFPRLVGG
jgi:hypothetical protein